jgi:subtilisin family serine protease
LIELHAGHLASADCGAVTVAVIDTGVDPAHPVLAGALMPGYDFLQGEAGAASEWGHVDQSVRAILEEELTATAQQSVRAILEGHGEVVMLDALMGPILDPALAGELDINALPPFFGHGTMVAGVVRLVAPNAQIMPLKVFDGHGTAHLFDIVEAIRYAVDHGADVINMSFSMGTHSTELLRAIQYARDHGVVCVAAAGNLGERTLVYPAALPSSVGVAATDLDDQLSDFSNYGSQLVKLAAPGTGLVSTFPGGHFAAGWGTSFSAPLVAGTVALIHSASDGDTAAVQHTIQALSAGSAWLDGLGGEIGSGRLNVHETVLAAE